MAENLRCFRKIQPHLRARPPSAREVIETWSAECLAEPLSFLVAELVRAGHSQRAAVEHVSAHLQSLAVRLARDCEIMRR